MRREVHFGTVVDNEDPDKRGGLKVRVDTLLDQLPLLEEYIPPTFPFAGNSVGWFFVPDVGAQVEVEVATDDEQSVEDIDARWRSALYSANDEPPAELTSDYPNRAGIKFGQIVFILDKTKDLMALVGTNVHLGEEGATHPVIRGDTYNTQEAQMLTLVMAYMQSIAGMVSGMGGYLNQVAADMGALNALPIGGTTPPFILPQMTALDTSAALGSGGLGGQATAAAAAAAGIQAFINAATTWLSTKVKTE